MKKKSLIVDEKIELKLADENFAKELYKIIDTQREYLGQWFSWIDDTNEEEDTRRFLKQSRLFNRGGQKLITFIFYEKKIVGSVGLVYISKEHDYAEMGYWLSQDFQKKGIMTKACKRIIDYTYQHTKVHRIEIEAATGNKKSQSIPKRLGFKHEGTMRECSLLRGKYYDMELYSMLKWQWENKTLEQ